MSIDQMAIGTNKYIIQEFVNINLILLNKSDVVIEIWKKAFDYLKNFQTTIKITKND